MSVACEKHIGPVVAGPDAESRLNIDVLFTSAQATRAALRSAGALARRLDARITLVVPLVVPYPCPLTSPPVLLDFSRNRFRALAGSAQTDTTVQLYLCRDKWEPLKVLKPGSLVVVAGRRRWRRTQEDRLVTALRRSGHEVVFVAIQ